MATARRADLPFEVRATSDSHFSWVRTRLSAERTLMSWARTGTALIGFGFTIVQFLGRLAEAPGTRPPILPPRDFGLALIAAGVLALVIAAEQYRWLLRYLWSPQFSAIAGVHGRNHATPILFVVWALALVGIVAFAAVLMRA